MIYKGRIRQRKPVFEVTLEGEAASLGGEYEVMLDTGFSGFLYVPKQIASDLGISRESMSPVIVADGRRLELPTAECTVIIGNSTTTGIAYLAGPAPGLFLGMQYLEKAGLQLRLNPTKGRCELSDDL